MLAGHTALISGCTSGIGLATAKVFASEGCRVIATGRNAEALASLSAELGDKLLATIQADLTVEGEPTRVVAEAAAADGGFSLLVNVAGVLEGGAVGSAACTMENYHRNFRGNTQQVVEMTVAAIPHLKAAAQAGLKPSVVTVTSVNGMQSFAACANYCAAKAATDMWMRCAALDLAADGIRVNTVNPGVVMTPLQRRGGMSEEAYEAFIARSVDVTHPLAKATGGVATAEDVGNLICFLSSAKASFITGDNVRIDGGRACLGAR